ncbi:probable phosphoglycerate mutase [Methylomagnum ishizawai]|uniref:Probable phosphoglycerate mutase n=1 Tax=Methylomagnum ishizawai TaxID=1760988 RepID=A0A1Y6CU98_9GAMM|nr:histidine phosphatase family protein [Methylomagnum ishizawai]SMF94198.1 probable phosphoglycerate mutase [Methylomagnum ishizawai]
MALNLYLLRHGETESSRTGGFCGRLDIELSPIGQQMAEDFGQAYREHVWAGIYASPMRRTRATVEPLCRLTGAVPELRDGLREIDYGAWEGKTADAVRREYPEDYLRWLGDAGWNGPTGGERGIDVGQRALAVVDEIRARHASGDVLVVSHKATIRVLLCQMLGIDVGHYRDRIDTPVASLSVVELRDHGPLLRRLGDRSHLRPELRDLPGT